ncbi:hypothetical protein FRC11_011722, partial [Ceratobasidium sp. 423]
VVVSKWDTATKYLVEVMGSCWADLDAEALGRWQEQLPSIIRKIMSLLHYVTGCKLYTVGSVMMGKEHYSF